MIIKAAYFDNLNGLLISCLNSSLIYSKNLVKPMAAKSYIPKSGKGF